VSAVANPSTGVAVYDSYGSTNNANWYVYGGTSVAAPLVAGIWALGPGVTSGLAAAIPYANAGGFWDVISGTNTRNCRSGYLCSAVGGYDGPTGLGTPHGIAGFNSTTGGSTGGGGGSTTATKVHVDSVGYSKSKNGMLIAIHVDDNTGASVPGATVSISLSGPASGTGSAATGSNGTVSFKVNRAPIGEYTTTITNITGTNLSWDHTGVTSYTATYSG
jgi:hypothetical protein